MAVHAFNPCRVVPGRGWLWVPGFLYLLSGTFARTQTVPDGREEPRAHPAALIIHANQFAYDSLAPKNAVVDCAVPLPAEAGFAVVDAATGSNVFQARLGSAQMVTNWFPNRVFYRADFSAFTNVGRYYLSVTVAGRAAVSYPFDIGQEELAALTIPAITGFYHHQRANSPEELGADKHLILFGSTNTVDLHGGWCDASGDVSKYFSHLAYANVMSPQQTPLVVWSLANAYDNAGARLPDASAREALAAETLYGADYVRRSLSEGNFFYMTVFSYFKKDPSERRVVGLLADSKTTSDYQCAYREGGGMGIAALARVAQWHRNGDFTWQQYLEGAERAFAHLEKNNLRYDDDGRENIIDDYCALMAAAELWIATDKPVYRDAARKRARQLGARQSPVGYFLATDDGRPFWHAADAGLPLIALARYLDKETDPAARAAALGAIKAFLDYQLKVTANTANPFGYARQTFRFRGRIQDGFFIPHENETGWWWQGEDARLGSLAAAALIGGRLVYPDPTPLGVKPELATFATDQLSWVLGGNPYDICMMYQMGRDHVPYMKSMYGHGTGRGGVSNGITGRKDQPDGSGIDFRFEDNGNEWRWTEQWIPHSAWFLQAVTALAARP